MRFIRSVALVAMALAACEAPSAPVLADGAQRFEPPPVYELWWNMTLACSGRRAPMSTVRWYVVPRARTVEVAGERYAAYWSAAGNVIVVAEASQFDGALIRHEMLHSLVSGGRHPRDQFLGRCGGIVACDERCVADAEPLPPLSPGTTSVTPDALEIDVEVSDPLDLARYGGFFTVTVAVTNPRGDPVVVRLPPAPGGPSQTFGYRLDNAAQLHLTMARQWDAGTGRFAPGETKRHVFDLHLLDSAGIEAGGVTPGSYSLWGGFGGRWTPVPLSVFLSAP